MTRSLWVERQVLIALLVSSTLFVLVASGCGPRPTPSGATLAAPFATGSTRPNPMTASASGASSPSLQTDQG